MSQSTEFSALKQQAIQAYQSANYKRAATLFDTLLKEYPNDHPLRAKYAYSLLKLEKYPLAEKELNFIIQYALDQKLVNYAHQLKAYLPGTPPSTSGSPKPGESGKTLVEVPALPGKDSSIGNTSTSYTINSDTFDTSPELSAIQQSRSVSLELDKKPVSEALKMITEKSGNIIRWQGPDPPQKISLMTENAPFWAALMAVCQNKWSFKVSPEPGKPVLVNVADKPPIQSYQTQGPLLFTWNGLQPVSAMSGGLQFELHIDPGSHIDLSHLMGQPLPFTFTLSSGQQMVLKPNKTLQSKNGNLLWEFSPYKKLLGDTVTVEVKLPLSVPTAEQKAALEWEAGSAKKVGRIEVSLQQGQSLDDTTLQASFFMQKEKSLLEAERKKMQTLQDRIRKEKRLPTQAEQQQLDLLARSGATIKAKRAVLIGSDGKQIEGSLTGTYQAAEQRTLYQAQFKVPAEFIPIELEVFWGAETRHQEIPFRIKNVSLT